MSDRRLSDPLRFSFGTLTAVRVPPPRSIASPVPGRAMALAPLAGLVPGVTAAAVCWPALRLGLSTPVVAVLAVGLFALTTRGLHLDGLADTADGLAASYQRERALEVMRRGDTGPTGLATTVLVLLLQTAALSQVLSGAVLRCPAGAVGQLRAVAILVAVTVAARVAVPLTCVQGVPSARPEGLGATVAGSVPRAGLLLVLTTTTAGCGLAAALAGFSWWTGPLAVLVVTAATAVVVRRAVQRFGGITGDVIGAAVEIATAATLLTLAACS